MENPEYVVEYGRKRIYGKQVDDIARVAIGLSGGVDSAAAAYLMKEQGYEVTGVMLKTGPWCDTGDARRAARQIGIPFFEIDCAHRFGEYVTEPFVERYIGGMTPNPCVACNRHIKWDCLLDFADKKDIEYIATGHYARIVMTDDGRYTVQQSAAAAKDQTYMLYQLSQDQLRRTIMPLAEFTKDEVRTIALGAGLSVAEKKDSQEICFVPDGDHTGFIASQAGDAMPPPGCFTDMDGNVLGTHKGIVNYTVGQRKGLGIALGRPAYVKRIDAPDNTVVLCDDESLYSCRIKCRELHFMSVEGIVPGETVRANVKIRYHHAAAAAEITGEGEDTVSVSFDTPVRAPAPGQSAVFYDNEGRVIGGGIIQPDEL